MMVPLPSPNPRPRPHLSPARPKPQKAALTPETNIIATSHLTGATYCNTERYWKAMMPNLALIPPFVPSVQVATASGPNYGNINVSPPRPKDSPSKSTHPPQSILLPDHGNRRARSRSPATSSRLASVTPDKPVSLTSPESNATPRRDDITPSPTFGSNNLLPQMYHSTKLSTFPILAPMPSPGILQAPSSSPSKGVSQIRQVQTRNQPSDNDSNSNSNQNNVFCCPVSDLNNNNSSSKECPLPRIHIRDGTSQSSMLLLQFLYWANGAHLNLDQVSDSHLVEVVVSTTRKDTNPLRTPAQQQTTPSTKSMMTPPPPTSSAPTAPPSESGLLSPTFSTLAVRHFGILLTELKKDLTGPVGGSTRVGKGEYREIPLLVAAKQGLLLLAASRVLFCEKHGLFFEVNILK